MSTVKISVLIPVYGVEDYIERCARSLFEQTMKEGIEFIFTDDCTPDKSIEVLLSILEDYPERKHQVKILRHPENKGLAEARKTGVKASQGEYIIHCDSDDWVEPDMYESMWKEAKRIDADIVGCDIIEEKSDGSVVLKQDFRIEKDRQFEVMLNHGTRNLERYVWNRLIKRELYVGLGFDNPDIGLWEDVCLTVPLHYLAKKVGYVAKPLYHYNRTNQNSYVSSFSARKADDMLKAGEYLEDFCSRLDMTKGQKVALENRLLAAKMPLICYKETFDPAGWRKKWPDLSTRNYPSIKMRAFMLLALLKMDWLLKKMIK